MEICTNPCFAVGSGAVILLSIGEAPSAKEGTGKHKGGLRPLLLANNRAICRLQLAAQILVLLRESQQVAAEFLNQSSSAVMFIEERRSMTIARRGLECDQRSRRTEGMFDQG